MSLRDDLDLDLVEIFASEAGTLATVTPAAGGPTWKLPGILRSPYRPQPMGSMEVGAQGYGFMCRTAAKAAGGLKRGDRLTIDGADYKLTEPQDGNPTAGISTLQLAPL